LRSPPPEGALSGFGRPGATDMTTPMRDEQRRANRRLGLILASVAVAFALGFVAKMVVFA
jgi:hypothetical protein